MAKKILVTGGAGFIGSHLIDALIAKGHKVIAFDNLEPQVHPKRKLPQYFNKKAEFIKGDVRNKTVLLKVVNSVDVIFHLAAAVGIGQSMYQVKKYIDVNIGGIANILDVLVNSRHPVKKLIIPGSATSYGECAYKCPKCGAIYPSLRTAEQIKRGRWEPICPKCKGKIKHIGIREDKPLDCQFIYSLTKKWQEELALSIGKTYNIPVTILRLFNVYGPRQSLFNPYTGVISIFAARLKEGRAPIVIEDGLQTRDFISVHDVVSAFILVMGKEKANFEVFNVGTGKSTTIKKLAQILIHLYSRKVEPKINFAFRKGDVRHSQANISKIKRKLGWRPKITIQQGLKEVLLWSKKQPSKDRFEEAFKELVKRRII